MTEPSRAVGWARHRGLVLAVIVAAAAIAFQFHSYRRAIRGYDRYNLPAFDPYVYVAMAEQPPFFTVAPWGYRILTPWIAHWMSARSPIPAYRRITFVGLVATGTLLFLFLRRLGHGEWPSLLAVAAFSLASPTGEAVQAPFLGEPLALLLEVAFLLAVEMGAAVSVLALLAAFMAYSKEIFFLFLPLVYLATRPRLGRARALAAVAVVAVPAAIVSQSLRLWWTPHVQVPHPALNLDLLRIALVALRDSWGMTWPPLLLGGLMPLAVLGCFQPRARPFLARYGYLGAATIALAFVAWLNVPSATPVVLFGSNVERLLVYALPVLIPLALFALDRAWPHVIPPPPPAPPPRLWSALAAVVVVACVAFPFVGLDRYRRVPLHSQRDGLLVLTLCRESLKAARRLDQGWPVSWNLDEMGFESETTDPRDAQRIRWFLRDGWGANPEYGLGQVRMAGWSASFLLPTFTPRPRELALTMSGSEEERVDIAVNGVQAGSAMLKTAPAEYPVHVPDRLLFRGDNLVTLTRWGRATPGPRLHALSIRPAS